MFDPDADAPPVNPLPPVVIVLALVMGVVELVFQLGEAGIIGGPQAIGWRGSIASTFGFSNNVAIWMWETGHFPPEHLMRFVTYPFIHVSFGDALFSIIFVLALGKFVGERVSSLVFVLVFFGSGIIAALANTVFFGTQGALLGADASTYGLIGAYTWILFGRLQNEGEDAFQAFRLIGSLAVLHVIFYFIFGGNDWLARASGFVGGFAISTILRPKEAAGISYLLERLRKR